NEWQSKPLCSATEEEMKLLRQSYSLLLLRSSLQARSLPSMADWAFKPIILLNALKGRGFQPPPYASAEVGSIIRFTSETLFAGKPPCLACSRTIASLGAI